MLENKQKATVDYTCVKELIQCNHYPFATTAQNIAYVLCPINHMIPVVYSEFF